MLNKPIEYWFVLIGMILYVATRDAERQPILKRTGKTLASAALAVGLSPDIAAWVNASETIATVGIMAFGMIVLDVGTAIVSDRNFIKELVRNRLGGPGDGKS
jgi:uncharacterized membrane protein YoaK (UPF0700 family)